MTVKYNSISDLRTSEKLSFSIVVNYKNLMHIFIYDTIMNIFKIYSKEMLISLN